MRTTITLTPAAEEALRKVMRERGLSFKDAVNSAILAGLAPDAAAPFETPVRQLGQARLPLDRALALAADLEDEAIAQKHELGK